jgi:hypothetical protein
MAATGGRIAREKLLYARAFGRIAAGSRSIGQFFDQAIYYTVWAYMREASEEQERFAAQHAS